MINKSKIYETYIKCQIDNKTYMYRFVSFVHNSCSIHYIEYMEQKKIHTCNSIDNGMTNGNKKK